MARCGCAGSSCSCVVKGSGGVQVTGAGSAANPYIVSSELNVTAVDTATVDMTVSGTGSVADPYQISAVAMLSLDDLTDVSTAGGTTGKVLAKQADGSYALVPPVTATAGTIFAGNGLQGDGTSGNPLAVKLAPSSGLVLDGTGLRVAGAGAWTAYTPTLTATTTNPNLGNGSTFGRYVQIGKTVHFYALITFGSTTTRGSGSYQVSLPVPMFVSGASVQPTIQMDLGSGATEFVGRARLNVSGGASKAYPLQIIANGADTDMTWVSGTNPTTMPAGSFIRLTGTYEAA